MTLGLQVDSKRSLSMFWDIPENPLQSEGFGETLSLSVPV